MKNLFQNTSDSFWDRSALFVVLGTFIFWTFVLQYKYAYFGYYDWDLALYAQAMWGISHGVMEPSLWGTNFLTNHAEYISFLLIPFYKLFPHPLTLITFKIFSFCSAMWIFFLFARQFCSRGLAFFLMVAYLFFPPNVFMMIYEFHFENLALPFIFLLFYFFWAKENFVFFSITALFAALIKENIALVVAMFGFLAIFCKRGKGWRWVLTPIGIGGGIFVFSIFFFIPYLRHVYGLNSQNQYIGMYLTAPASTASSSFVQILGANFKNLWFRFFSLSTLNYLRDFFLPFNFLVFFNPLALVAGVPLFFQHLLSSDWKMRSIFFHYGASVVPFLFTTVVFSLNSLRRFLNPQKYYFFLTIMFVTLGLYPIAVLQGKDFRSKTQWVDELDFFRWKMVERIPPREGVLASFDFLAELSSRKDLFSFHNVWQGVNVFSLKGVDQANILKWAAIDFNCPWLRTDVLLAEPEGREKIFQRIHQFFNAADWRVVMAADNLILFKKNGNGPRLVEVNPSAVSDYQGWGMDVDGVFSLISFNTSSAAVKRGTAIPMEFVWRSTMTTDNVYMAAVDIVKNGKKVFRRLRRIGYAIYPTVLWQKGETIRERYWLMIPERLTPGEYQLIVSFYREPPSIQAVSLRGMGHGAEIISSEFAALGRINVF